MEEETMCGPSYPSPEPKDAKPAPMAGADGTSPKKSDILPEDDDTGEIAELLRQGAQPFNPS